MAVMQVEFTRPFQIGATIANHAGGRIPISLQINKQVSIAIALEVHGIDGREPAENKYHCVHVRDMYSDDTRHCQVYHDDYSLTVGAILDMVAAAQEVYPELNIADIELFQFYDSNDGDKLKAGISFIAPDPDSIPDRFVKDVRVYR